GLQLGVVRRDVDHHVKLLALGMRFVDAQRQVGVVELIVAHPQAVARLPGIHGVGAIGEGVAHGLEGPGGREQFGAKDAGHGKEPGWRTKRGDSTAKHALAQGARSVTTLASVLVDLSSVRLVSRLCPPREAHATCPSRQSTAPGRYLGFAGFTVLRTGLAFRVDGARAAGLAAPAWRGPGTDRPAQTARPALAIQGALGALGRSPGFGASRPSPRLDPAVAE